MSWIGLGEVGLGRFGLEFGWGWVDWTGRVRLVGKERVTRVAGTAQDVNAILAIAYHNVKHSALRTSLS